MTEIRSYTGIVRAFPGTLLLGGVVASMSIKFPTKKGAQAWIVAVIESNVKAGRQVCEAEIYGSAANPEVTE